MTTEAEIEIRPIHWRMPDGTDVIVRPIRPQDAAIEQAFVRALSPESRYYRFMQSLPELTPDMLEHLTHIDPERDLALIAVALEQGKEVELGVARYFSDPDGARAELSIVVDDRRQNQGLGSFLLSKVVEHARAHGLKFIEGEVLTENRHMLDFIRRRGFSIHRVPDNPEVCRVVLKL